MKSVKQLPEGYRPLRQIDLQADRRAFWIVNGLALAILVALAAAGALMVPLETVFSANGVGEFVAKAVVMIVGSIAYIVGHEWVHGIFMKYFSDAKVSYGFTGCMPMPAAVLILQAALPNHRIGTGGAVGRAVGCAESAAAAGMVLADLFYTDDQSFRRSRRSVCQPGAEKVSA